MPSSTSNTELGANWLLESLASVGQLYLCALPISNGVGTIWAGTEPKAVVKGRTYFLK